MTDDINIPSVIDDDEGTITVKYLSKKLRGWCYDNDDQRRTKMQLARDYVEGWCDGYHHMRQNAEVIKGIHLRARLRKAMAMDVDPEVRELIIERFWPKAKGD